MAKVTLTLREKQIIDQIGYSLGGEFRYNNLIDAYDFFSNLKELGIIDQEFIKDFYDGDNSSWLT